MARPPSLPGDLFLTLPLLRLQGSESSFPITKSYRGDPIIRMNVSFRQLWDINQMEPSNVHGESIWRSLELPNRGEVGDGEC